MNTQDVAAIAEFAAQVRRQYSVGFLQGTLFGGLIAVVVWAVLR